MPRLAIVSFRLGLRDGVSIVAATWQRALGDLGFDVVTVAGEGPVDRTVAGLGLQASAPPDRDELRSALADVDLVVAENVLTIPLRLDASLALADELRGRPTLLHHHDPPWQRAHLAHHTELPAIDAAWRHVTINRRTEAEMAARGIEATTVYNGFEVPTGPGDRAGTRALLDVADDELLVGHPVRAIARKNIPAALALCEALDATYWLLGPAEDGYDDELDRLLAGARCRVLHQPLAHGPDVYAAPDLIAFPSTWEGFGNPPVEAALHRRPAAVGDYPVAHELRALGLQWLDPLDAPAVRRFLDRPDEQQLDANAAIVRRHFSYEAMRDGVAAVLDAAGWSP